jgi:hypothetical protein
MTSRTSGFTRRPLRSLTSWLNSGWISTGCVWSIRRPSRRAHAEVYLTWREGAERLAPFFSSKHPSRCAWRATRRGSDPWGSRSSSANIKPSNRRSPRSRRKGSIRWSSFARKTSIRCASRLCFAPCRAPRQARRVQRRAALRPVWRVAALLAIREALRGALGRRPPLPPRRLERGPTIGPPNRERPRALLGSRRRGSNRLRQAPRKTPAVRLPRRQGRENRDRRAADLGVTSDVRFPCQPPPAGQAALPRDHTRCGRRLTRVIRDTEFSVRGCTAPPARTCEGP